MNPVKHDIALMKPNTSTHRTLARDIWIFAAVAVVSIASVSLRAASAELKEKPATAIQHYNLGADKVALKGYDPVGYFTKNKDHMRYPEYRAKGWPIGSGVTEAAVKQFNKRVKGTEQSWNEAGVEPILMLRATWICQDERWTAYWANREAYVK